MIISAKVIKQPRWSRCCTHCGRDIFGPQLKLYGMAHYGEKPHNLYLHLECAQDPDKKIQAALNPPNKRLDPTPESGASESVLETK